MGDYGYVVFGLWRLLLDGFLEKGSYAVGRRKYDFFMHLLLILKAKPLCLQLKLEFENQVCMANSSGATPQFAQVIAPCADCILGGTRNT